MWTTQGYINRPADGRLTYLRNDQITPRGKKRYYQVGYFNALRGWISIDRPGMWHGLVATAAQARAYIRDRERAENLS